MNASIFYDDPAQRASALNILDKEGKLINYEFRLKRFNGDIRYCLINARTFKDEIIVNFNDEYVYIQGVITDITEKRNFEETQFKIQQAEKLAMQARFQSLRHQLNPHFLFNSINTIDAMAKTKPKEIENLLQKLSIYLRHTIMEKINKRVVYPLKEEVEVVKAYIDIEKIRFEDILEINFDITEDAMNATAPDMVLQPLVENAIKYGMQTSKMPLKVLINANIKDDKLHIKVKNSGKWVEHDQNSGNIFYERGVGLQNLQERLNIIYGNNSAININKSDGWVAVNIEIKWNFILI
ncbi:hypothetical protein MTBBW1_2140006 [Desulfamplus magnetovallimortis]|uniref:PAC domain-containing protein n=1 Tax=Desulfamplus magnetovallimortis TaxID=1246637 RepID=A0A1W1HCI1_9BACT|nr:hypothetical protein MTBBW1_2140006 [Desulfamplus magnetovallimortis]